MKTIKQQLYRVCPASIHWIRFWVNIKAKKSGDNGNITLQILGTFILRSTTLHDWLDRKNLILYRILSVIVWRRPKSQWPSIKAEEPKFILVFWNNCSPNVNTLSRSRLVPRNEFAAVPFLVVAFFVCNSTFRWSCY